MAKHSCFSLKTPSAPLKRFFLLTGLLAGCCRGFCAEVIVQPAQQFQTIAGWGHGGGVLGGTGGAEAFLPPTLADAVNYQYLDFLTDDLGLTGTRTWEVGPRIDGTGTDNGDCDVVDWNLFESDTFSAREAAYLFHYQNRILAEGYQPSFYSSPGYPTHASDQKPWVMSHPGERAQQIWASSLYLKTNYGINIAYAVIYNEPSMASAILTDDIKALGPRLTAQGLTTEIQYAEAVAPQTDWNYVTPVLNDAELWPYVGRISYHNYGTADPYRSYLRYFGEAKGLTTAQTEMGNPGFDDLFSDLTLGGVSYWEVAYSANATLVPTAGLTGFTPSGTYFRLRQLMHYVRPGAVRVGTASSDPLLRVLAFVQNGNLTAVIENTSSSAQTVNLSGLPAGSYGVSKAGVGTTSFQELGVRTVGTDGLLTLTNVAGGSAVTTLYTYAGTNQPPTIEVWDASPGYVVAPASSATLSAIASDPELAALTYHWSVMNQPPGANAAFANANAATTLVTGLTVAGTYVFNVAVSDGTNLSSRQVYLAVYDFNPQPVLGQTGFRIAAPYGLVFGNPSCITDATIELPTSSAVLQAGIADLANSDFTGRGTWSLVSQPPGANAGVSSTTYIFVSLRANVTNMTVTGDYLFQINVTNPGHPDLTAQIRCTVNPSSSPPVINSIMASPATVTLPTNVVHLSAITSGSTNQPLRHWWAIKTTPAGAKPLFDHQGATNTTVSNLNLPGNYTFTLRAFDDLHMTTLDKTVNVSATTGAPVINSAPSASVIAGAPFTYQITASGNPTGLGALKLAPGLAFSNGVISGTVAIVGTYNIQLAATNANGVGYGNLALTVKLPLPVITSSVTADGQLNAPFNFTVQASSVATSFTENGLPGGLILNSLTGAITGTPTNSGTFNVAVTAANSTGTTSNPLTIVIYNGVAPVPGITSALTATGSRSASFSYQITATNNPTSFFAVGLPPGLVFAPASGRIWGLPNVTGNFAVTLRASNKGGTGSAILALGISAEPPPRIDSISIQNGVALSFLTLTNWFYAVEWNTNLLNTSWMNLTSGIIGDGGTQAVTDPTTNAPTRFYRLKVSPSEF
ncbi:MAG TPA: putative Ig domain-containing protein [Verrucomicrobiae bacterium]|nr:putative Ig domain-containing protein [Verrucomicrobiae bacterium]